MLNICFAQQQPEHEPNGLAGRPSPLQKSTKGPLELQPEDPLGQLVQALTQIQLFCQCR
jgi:hypothetical protein